MLCEIVGVDSILPNSSKQLVESVGLGKTDGIWIPGSCKATEFLTYV